MSILLALLLLIPANAFQPSTASSSENLQKSVSQFCELLKTNDKASALKLVHPDDLNNFINRREQPVVSWKVVETKFVSEDNATVTVQFEQLVSRSRVPVPKQQQWQKTDQGWKIRIGSSQEAYEKTREAFIQTNKRLLPKELSVYPEQLKIYEMAKPKIGSVAVRNGLQKPAKLVSFELDTSEFEILSLPDIIQPGEIGRIRVKYLGEAQEENLESEATLHLEQDGELKTFQVPIIYNYADDVTRWLSEKAGKEREQLRKQTTSPKPPISPSPH